VGLFTHPPKTYHRDRFSKHVSLYTHGVDVFLAAEQHIIFVQRLSNMKKYFSCSEVNGNTTAKNIFFAHVDL
jgi:hypothetical protein